MRFALLSLAVWFSLAAIRGCASAHPLSQQEEVAILIAYPRGSPAVKLSAVDTEEYRGEHDDEHHRHHHQHRHLFSESSALDNEQEEERGHEEDDHEHEEDHENEDVEEGHSGHAHFAGLDEEALQEYCSSQPSQYNESLAIASIFVILVVSFIGAIAPPLARRYLKASVGSLIVKVLAFVGGGVILSTAFIHLLPHANEKLSSPCLPEGWLEAYHPGFAFLFCFCAIAIMMVMDFIVDALFGEKSGHQHASSFMRDDQNDTMESGLAAAVAAGALGQKSHDQDERRNGDQHHHDHGYSTTANIQNQEDKGQAIVVPVKALILSEVSIAVHSVIIGVALGTASEDSFDTLFIAIIFHQFLEGLALGAIAIHTNLKVRSMLLFAILYALTTPIGIAIGIGVQGSMNQNSEGALLTQGIFDAIAAGMMIYVALGDHINAIKCYGSWLKHQGWPTVFLCMGAFLVGGAVMAVIGIWQ